MKTPEDEEFERIEREAEGWRKRQIERLDRAKYIKSMEECFDEWEHSHRPEQYYVELRAFKAGFLAGQQQAWLKERND